MYHCIVQATVEAEADADNATALAIAAAEDKKAEQCGFFVTDFDKTSLTNVEAESMKLWVHVGAIYLITFIILTVRPPLWPASDAPCTVARTCPVSAGPVCQGVAPLANRPLHGAAGMRCSATSDLICSLNAQNCVRVHWQFICIGDRAPKRDRAR